MDRKLFFKGFFGVLIVLGLAGGAAWAVTSYKSYVSSVDAYNSAHVKPDDYDVLRKDVLMVGSYPLVNGSDGKGYSVSIVLDVEFKGVSVLDSNSSFVSLGSDTAVSDDSYPGYSFVDLVSYVLASQSGWAKDFSAWLLLGGSVKVATSVSTADATYLSSFVSVDSPGYWLVNKVAKSGDVPEVKHVDCYEETHYTEE